MPQTVKVPAVGADGKAIARKPQQSQGRPSEQVAATRGMPHGKARERSPLPPRAVIVGLSATVAAVVFTAIANAYAGWTFAIIEHWALIAVFAVAAFSCAARAVVHPPERRAWALFAIGLVLYGLGTVTFNIWLAGEAAAPFPSASDWLWLSLSVAAVGGLIMLARARRLRVTPTAVLDGLIVALGLTALCGAIVFQPVFDEVIHQGISFGLVPPIADLIVVSTAVVGLSLRGWQVSPAAVAIGLGFLLMFAGDSIYVLRAAGEGYAAGTGIDVLYAIGTALVGLAPWLPPPVPPVAGARERALVIPLAAGSVGVGMTAAMAMVHLNAVAEISTVLLMFLLVIRLGAGMLNYGELLRRSRTEALTDPLTGLANRRRLLTDLEQVGGRPTVLAIYDLDGFKGYNDLHGHSAGDELLSELGRRLGGAVEPWGRAYRMGGDEFCVLVDPDAASEAIPAAVRALTTTVNDVSIGCSWGAVSMPDEVKAGSEALSVADARMYAMKNLRPNSARSQLRGVLMAVLRARDPGLHEHLHDVERLAADVARELGLDAQERTDVVHGAVLHDVGKLAVPEAILAKEGPLSAEEWEEMRLHTIRGEQLLAGIPALAGVARLVRSSHERWDGAGYPDGLAGEEIPLGARIVQVCDAYDAMVTDRSYREALGHADAIRELRRCSGSQFDPTVVGAFLRVLSGDRFDPSQVTG